MNIDLLQQQRGKLESFLHSCSETERLRIFRQFCYEKRMFEGDSEEIYNKALFDRVGRVFASMGYRDRF